MAAADGDAFARREFQHELAAVDGLAANQVGILSERPGAVRLSEFSIRGPVLDAGDEAEKSIGVLLGRQCVHGNATISSTAISARSRARTQSAIRSPSHFDTPIQ
jgi:hypothetical protein